MHFHNLLFGRHFSVISHSRLRLILWCQYLTWLKEYTMLSKFRELYKIWFTYNFKICRENVHTYTDIYLFLANCILTCYHMLSHNTESMHIRCIRLYNTSTRFLGGSVCFGFLADIDLRLIHGGLWYIVYIILKISARMTFTFSIW